MVPAQKRPGHISNETARRILASQLEPVYMSPRTESAGLIFMVIAGLLVAFAAYAIV